MPQATAKRKTACRAVKAPRPIHPFHPVRFVKNLKRGERSPGIGGQRHFFAVEESTGSFDSDCAIGRAHALDYLTRLTAATNGDCTLLGSAMIELADTAPKSVSHGVLIGFGGVLAETLAAFIGACPDMVPAMAAHYARRSASYQARSKELDARDAAEAAAKKGGAK